MPSEKCNHQYFNHVRKKVKNVIQIINKFSSIILKQNSTEVALKCEFRYYLKNYQFNEISFENHKFSNHINRIEKTKRQNDEHRRSFMEEKYLCCERLN